MFEEHFFVWLTRVMQQCECDDFFSSTIRYDLTRQNENDERHEDR